MEIIPAATIEAIVATVEPSSIVVGTSALPGGLSSWTGDGDPMIELRRRGLDVEGVGVGRTVP